ISNSSISGEYKTATNMALEFAGMPEEVRTARPKKNANFKLNLFVPERHNVESIHFNARDGRHLHPELAVVQTAGREESTIILKSNGVSIGENEEIGEMWKELLRCDGQGIAAM
ncbi:hypothetical protein M422DRAFT_153974, partial [Sphaerobolus stellatus SS14]